MRPFLCALVLAMPTSALALPLIINGPPDVPPIAAFELAGSPAGAIGSFGSFDPALLLKPANEAAPHSTTTNLVLNNSDLRGGETADNRAGSTIDRTFFALVVMPTTPPGADASILPTKLPTEPASLGMLSAGLAGLALSRMRIRVPLRLPWLRPALRPQHRRQIRRQLQPQHRQGLAA